MNDYGSESTHTSFCRNYAKEQLLASDNMEVGAVMFILNFRRPEFCYLFSPPCYYFLLSTA
ncbi:MAG: hypothetical protein WBF33_35190, partial [Candidatus Nitrosopolaris sp.]